jgi:hypothetical protein
MDSTTGSPGPSSPDSGHSPPPIEIIIGLLALVLALAAVVVAIAQLHQQARAAERLHRQADPESEQNSIEMLTRIPSQQ